MPIPRMPHSIYAHPLLPLLSKWCSVTRVLSTALPAPPQHRAFKDFWRLDCSWNYLRMCHHATIQRCRIFFFFFGLDRGRSSQTHYKLWQQQETSKSSTATTSLARKSPDMKHSWQWAAAWHRSRGRTTGKSSQEGHDDNHADELMQQQLGLAVNNSSLHPPSPLFLWLYWGSGGLKPLVRRSYSVKGGTFGASLHEIGGDAVRCLAHGVLGNRTSLQGSGATGGKSQERVEGSQGPCWVMWLLFLRRGSS